MKKVNIKTAITKKGYSAACDLLPGWVVSQEGDFGEFKKYVQESINFSIGCSKRSGESYPDEFKGDYDLVYEFDVQSLLEYYRGIFSFSALQIITGINQKQLSRYALGLSRPRKNQVEKIMVGLNKLACELMEITVE